MTKGAQEKLDQIIARFQSGDMSPIVAIAKTRLPDDAPASKWSFANRVLAYSLCNHADCRGYRQWESAGRHVKKGEHGGYIFAPRMVKDKESQDEDKTRLAGWLTISVFGAGQTEGDTALPDYAPRELPPLADLAARMGVPVSYTPTPEDRLGDTNGRDIHLGTTDAQVFFHELSHVIDRKIRPADKRTDTVQNEAIADLTACVLMHMYGLGDRTGNTWEYVKMFDNNPMRAITRALETVGKVLEYIEQT